MKFGIGQPVTRLEDQRLLTGRGRYTDDLAAREAARAFILRSPHAHADIGAIATGAARAAPVDQAPKLNLYGSFLSRAPPL